MIDAKINSTDMKSRNTMNTQKNIIKKTNSCPMFQMIWKKPVNTDKYLDHLRSKWYALISLSYYDRLIYVEYTIGRTFKNLNLGQTLWIYIYIYTHIYCYRAESCARDPKIWCAPQRDAGCPRLSKSQLKLGSVSETGHAAPRWTSSLRQGDWFTLW